LQWNFVERVSIELGGKKSAIISAANALRAIYTKKKTSIGWPKICHTKKLKSSNFFVQNILCLPTKFCSCV
jgi:hypothetical protein